jgi:hypothetical protein
MLEDNLPTLECLKDKIQHRQVDEVSNKLPLYKPQAANITVQQTKRHVQLQNPKILVSFHQSKTYKELPEVKNPLQPQQQHLLPLLTFPIHLSSAHPHIDSDASPTTTTSSLPIDHPAGQLNQGGAANSQLAQIYRKFQNLKLAKIENPYNI